MQQGELFADRFIFSQSNENLADQLAQITSAPDEFACATCTAKPPPTVLGSNPRKTRDARQIADAWCAAFVWLKTKDAPPAIVNRVFRALRKQGSAAIPPDTGTEIDRLQYRVRLLPLAP